MAGSLGFVGCGGIDEDPDAAANEAKEAPHAPKDLLEDGGDEDDNESKGEPSGEGKVKEKKEEGEDDDDE